MAATTTPRPESPGLVPRFDRVERVVHWVNASLFGVLMITGAVLYAGPLSAIVGRRELVRTIHVYSGLALPLPLLVAVAMRGGAQLRRDLGRLNRFAPGEARWFRRSRRDSVELGKFNPGQKLNAVFIAAAGVVMLATGSIMKWFSHFPIDWRTGATFVHDWFALGIWLAVAGHIAFAMNDPVARLGMTRGYVTTAWARAKRPRWYAEVTATPPAETDAETPESNR
jgi:formate dehydrogenase subunit gamma